jgi:hypothetical protein
MDLRCNGVINCPNDNTYIDNCTMIVTDDTYKKDYAPVKFGDDDVMVKVDVNISMEIVTILAISEKDSLLKLKLVLNAYWFDHRVKFNNLKDDTSMNTVPSEEKGVMWLPAGIFKNTEKEDELKNDKEAFISIIKLGTYEIEDDEVLENRLLYNGNEHEIHQLCQKLFQRFLFRGCYDRKLDCHARSYHNVHQHLHQPSNH